MSEPYTPPTAPPPSGPPAHGAAGLPWDHEKTGSALIATAKGLITAPGQAYAEMREKGDYLSPILFAIILGTVGGVIGQIWNLLFGATYLGMMPPELREGLGEFLAPGVGSVIINIVLAPVFVLFGLFIVSAIYHLFLLLVGGTKDSTAGFEGTVRAVSYGHVANLALIIPIVGSVVAVVWGIVLYIIGLSSVHRTSGGRAAAAVLLPIVLCCLCLGAIVFFAGAAILAAIGAASQ